MSLKKEALSGLFWKLMERGGRSIVELVVQIAMARLLTPDDFGALAIMLVFINVGNVIVQSGLNTALVQAPSVDETDCSTVFWLSLVAAAILYTCVFVSAPVVASFYELEQLTWPLRIIALILPISAFNSVQVAIVQRTFAFNKVFAATIIAVFISGIAGVISASMGVGIWALVIQQIMYHVCNCCVLALKVRWFPRFEFKPRQARILFGFGWKLLMSGLLDQGYQSLSDLIIGRQFNASSLGLINQGKKYPQAVGNMLDGAIQPVMLSAVSHVQTDISQVKRLIRRALKTSTYLIMPAMTLFAVAAEPLVQLLLGDPWLPCVPFLQMYCFTYALLPIHTTNLQALNGVGRSDLFLKLEVIKKSYGIILLLVAAFVFHDVYLMVATYMLSGVISTFVNSWPNKRIIGYSYREQLRDIAPSLALSVVAGACALTVPHFGFSDVPEILMETLVMASVYLVASKLFHVEAFEYLVRTALEFLHRSRKPNNL